MVFSCTSFSIPSLTFIHFFTDWALGSQKKRKLHLSFSSAYATSRRGFWSPSKATIKVMVLSYTFFSIPHQLLSTSFTDLALGSQKAKLHFRFACCADATSRRGFWSPFKVTIDVMIFSYTSFSIPSLTFIHFLHCLTFWQSKKAKSALEFFRRLCHFKERFLITIQSNNWGHGLVLYNLPDTLTEFYPLSSLA